MKHRFDDPQTRTINNHLALMGWPDMIYCRKGAVSSPILRWMGLLAYKQSGYVNGIVNSCRKLKGEVNHASR